jgi:hypothetical protein
MTSAEAATPAPNAPTACGAPGRDPTPAELSHFLPQGGTVDQVDVAILGSPEYYDLNGGTDTTFVRALYRDLLTRQPDPAGVAAASTVLGGPWQQDQGAHARAQLAGAILGSSEYRSLAVHRLDLMLIGRPPTAAEVQAATTTTTASAERRGLEVDQDLVAGIVSSPEFLALAGGTDSGFAALLYHDLLGRSPTDAEVQSLAGYKDLDAATRQRTVVGIVNSPEYRTAAINQTFHALLRGGCFGAGQPHPQCHVATRQPTQAELAAALSQGQTDEQVRAAIMGSQEYLASAGGTDEGFARALYRDLLGRQPTPADLSSTRANLGAGGGKRDQVVAAILGSPEYRTIQVHDADSQFLGRSPSAAESTQGVATLAGGATTEELIAGILGSPEYFADAGASNEGFARALYRDVLERVSDAAPAAPVAQLDAGSTPTQVAGTILGSDEYRTKAVMLDDYLLLSPKPGTAGAACGTAPSRGLGFLDTVGKLPGGWIGPGILLLAFLLAGALAIRRVKVRFYWDRLGNRPGGAAAVAAASAAAVTGAAGGGAAAAASIRKGSVRGSVRIVDDMTGAPIDGVTVRFVPVAGGEVLTGTTDAAGRMQVMFNPKEYKTTQWEPHKAPGLDAPSQDVVVPPAAAAGDLTTNRLNVFLPDGTPIRARMTITWHPPEAQ